MRNDISSGSQLTPDPFVLHPQSPATLHAARLYVAAASTGAADCARLLDALGLREVEATPYVTTRSRYVHRAACKQLQRVGDRWPWRPADDGPGVARACSYCLPSGLPS